MSWKEKFENNLTLFVLGLLALGFASGFGANKWLIETAGQQFSTGRTELQAQLDLANNVNRQVQTLYDQCEQDQVNQSHLISNLRTETKETSAKIITTKTDADQQIDRLTDSIDGCKQDNVDLKAKLAAAAKKTSECQNADELMRKNAELSRISGSLKKDNDGLALASQRCKNELEKLKVVPVQKATRPDLDDTIKQILLYLYYNESATKGDLANRFSINMEKTQYYIDRLFYDYQYITIAPYRLTNSGRKYVVEQLAQ